jgi:chromate transporter
MWKLAASLFALCFPLSFVTIGGGQAIVAEVQRQIVNVHHWLTPAEFADIYAISRMAPGPGSLYITLVGWRVAGVPGALAATIGIFAPTIILTYCIAGFWTKFEKARWQRTLEAGLKPVAAGLVLSGVYVLFTNLNGAVLAQSIALGATALLLIVRVNPILILTAGGGISVAAHYLPLI